jgi:hypothetical protein
MMDALVHAVNLDPCASHGKEIGHRESGHAMVGSHRSSGFEYLGLHQCAQNDSLSHNIKRVASIFTNFYSAPAMAQVGIAGHIKSALSYPFRVISQFMLTFVKSPAQISIEVNPMTKNIMIAGAHNDGKRYVFVFTNKWHLLNTKADAMHFNVQNFNLYQTECANSNSTFNEPNQRNLSYTEMIPPTDWLEAVTVLVPEICFDSHKEMIKEDITVHNYVSKMQARIEWRNKHPIINVSPDWHESDAYKGVIVNYRPWILDDRSGFDMDNICLCCRTSSITDITEDALRDGFLFHFCRRTNIWYLLVESNWISEDIATEMLQNQRIAHNKFDTAKRVYDSDEYQLSEAANVVRYPDIMPEHPSDVMLHAGNNRREGSHGAVRYTPEIRTSCCEPGNPACTRVYDAPGHREMFIHAYPVTNSYIGLTNMKKVKIVRNENTFCPITEVDDVQADFLSGFMSANTNYYDVLTLANKSVRIRPEMVPNLLNPGRQLADVDVLPAFQDLSPSGMEWGEINGILDDLTHGVTVKQFNMVKENPDRFLTNSGSLTDILIAIMMANGSLNASLPTKVNFVPVHDPIPRPADPEVDADPIAPAAAPALAAAPARTSHLSMRPSRLRYVTVASRAASNAAPATAPPVPAAAPAPPSVCLYNVHCKHASCELKHWPTQICRHDGRCDRYPTHQCWFLHKDQIRHQVMDGDMLVNITAAGMASLPAAMTRPGIRR